MRQRDPVNRLKQALLQSAKRILGRYQGSPVEDGISFSAGLQKAGSGQDFQMVTHARLGHGEYSTQLKHTKRFHTQDTDNIEAQRISACLTEGK
jgi:hypothetical protein